MPRSDAHREADKRYSKKKIGRLVVDFVEGEEWLLDILDEIKEKHQDGKSGWIKNQIKEYSKDITPPESHLDDY